MVSNAADKTWAESASNPDVIVHTCRSWTLSTPGTPRITRSTSPPATVGGAPSSRMWPESRSTPHALARMRSAIAADAIGSASSQPVTRIAIEATMTPTEPSTSASTCRSAASMFRDSRPERARIANAATLTASPPTATASIQPPSTGGGSDSLRSASNSTHAATRTSSNPLRKAAMISARRKPKLRSGVAGRRASQIAPRASRSERTSESMWPASASSARLPVARPPATSATV
jgi:hypothetical protein